MHKRNVNIGIWLLLVAIAAAASSPAVAAEAVGDSDSDSAVVHIVLVWLREPGNLEHRREIIAATRDFEQIPGVIDVSVGQVVPSDRDVVDDSFDVGLYLTFSSVDAMNLYLADDRHQQALREVFRPLADHYFVYDFHDMGSAEPAGTPED